MKRNRKESDCKAKFAIGGIAKVRHNQATMDGKQKGTKKGSLKGCVYY